MNRKDESKGQRGEAPKDIAKLGSRKYGGSNDLDYKKASIRHGPTQQVNNEAEPERAKAGACCTTTTCTFPGRDLQLRLLPKQL